LTSGVCSGLLLITNGTSTRFIESCLELFMNKATC
jgi:hypothetical protein